MDRQQPAGPRPAILPRRGARSGVDSVSDFPPGGVPSGVGPATGRSALTAAQRDAVFARRAEALAESAAGEGQDDDTLEALVFALGREQYAVPASQVHE